MKSLLTLACALCLIVPLPLRALDPGLGVKAKPLVKTSESWDGTPLVYPKGEAEITGMLIEIMPGAETGWHLHPVPSFGMILEGQLTVSLKDGRTKELKTGDVIVEVVNTLHNGRNTGTTVVKLVVFYAGEKDGKLTVKP
ncbi:MAG TPA: cupin domain-containing protein [Roseimicrobium sp.]|nr:cupin domain-containing protein [Roseimicrobium sp.]